MDKIWSIPLNVEKQFGFTIQSLLKYNRSKSNLLFHSLEMRQLMPITKGMCPKRQWATIYPCISLYVPNSSGFVVGSSFIYLLIIIIIIIIIFSSSPKRLKLKGSHAPARPSIWKDINHGNSTEHKG